MSDEYDEGGEYLEADLEDDDGFDEDDEEETDEEETEETGKPVEEPVEDTVTDGDKAERQRIAQEYAPGIAAMKESPAGEIAANAAKWPDAQAREAQETDERDPDRAERERLVREEYPTMKGMGRKEFK